jgi:CMP-N-acetylneuraminic acid synthetase
MMHIGVVPARAGSKRFPGKNRAKLNGMALWIHAVDKSLEFLDLTYVNSDDKEIKFASEESHFFYTRPKHLRDGQSYRIDDVLIEMAQTLKWKDDDVIHLLQPTNPFTSRVTILKGKNAAWDYLDSVQSIWRVPNTLHAYSQRVVVDDEVKFVFPDMREKHYNSQRKPNFYSFAGYVACKVGSLLKYNNIWGERSLGIEVPLSKQST